MIKMWKGQTERGDSYPMVLPKVDTGAIASLQGKQSLEDRVTLGNELPGARMSSMGSYISITPVPLKSIL